ncbi:MAG: PhoD-like phosphatase N-terminal domain-containing protein [Gammaproteobacteria bacterium]
MHLSSLRCHTLATAFSGATIFLSACVAAAPALAPVTHGVAAGDVTTESAVIWSRTDQPAYMHVLVEGSHNDRGVHDIVKVNADGDYTGKVRVTGLKAGREYGYKVWFSTATAGRRGVDAAAEGRFRTPPASKLAEALVFGWAAIWRGKTSAVMPWKAFRSSRP